MGRCIGLSFRLLLVIACVAQVRLTPAAAQDVFNGGNQGGGNPNCPPPVINGITPKNWSCRTGPQYSEGNPDCPPPVILINGQPTTPKNWSCPGGMSSGRSGPIGPLETHHPGPPYVPGAANPCQPGGPGSYNWLNNPVGTQLPPGCVAPHRHDDHRCEERSELPNRAARQLHRAACGTARQLHGAACGAAGSYIVPPVGPPGSYIVPSAGPPGSYMVPPVGPPGSYVVPPAGPPGSYVNSTAGRR